MDRVCLSCGASNSESARFCASCGSALRDKCPTCGAELASDARFCSTCGSPVRTGEPADDEERKLVTVLFADVVGSTALGEQLDPERLRSVLSSWFSVASAAVEAWGGTVEKFIGDAVVGAFGVPVIREDDAARALHAALDMLDRLPGLNERFSQQHDVRLAIRVGVNTGEVIAPRATKPGEPLVAGDAVNVAARLQQDAEPGTVLVGERTYLAARGAFEFGAPVELVVRGKVASTQARRLVGSRIETERGIPGLAASMVGRDRELGALVQALDETRAISRPRLVVVMGSAGIGKSRLIREFVSASEAREEAVAILRGRCLAAGEKISYWALAEILRASAGISLDEPAESARDKLSRRVVETMAALPGGSMLAPSTFNALALTAGISVADSPLLELEPKAVADELSRAWPRFTTALSATGPVVLVIEDVHWASKELVEMLDRILTRSDGPVLIVATARPEFAQEHPQVVAPREDFLAVTLRPLSGDQSHRLLEELLAMADIP
ncbi:MAG: zinc-ribbon domain-containing protein, partial [Chloroflexi bacterium]